MLFPGVVATHLNSVPFSLDAFMAAQVDGLYFDATRTDLLYQEANGPTPADGDAEAIGLALDRRLLAGQTLSQFAAGQPELVINGGFDANLDGWSQSHDASATLTVVGGEAVSGGTGSSRLRQQISFTAGKRYMLTAEGSPMGDWWVSASPGGAIIPDMTTIGTGNVRFFSVPSTGLYWLSNRFDAGERCSRVSIKEIPGRYALQPTSAQRPILQAGGIKFDNADDSLLSNYLAGGGENFVVAVIDVPAVMSGFQWLFGASDAGSNRFLLGINNASGQATAGIGDASVSAGADLRGQTVTVGMSFDGSVRRLFVGDTLADQRVQAGLATTTVPARLGAANSAGTAANFFGGSIRKLVAGRQLLDLATHNKIRNALLAA